MQNESIIDSKEEALDFINRHGFVTLFPISGSNFPSLYRATKGSREEKFSKAWEWADELSVKEKQIYYGKLIRRQTTLISMEMFPYFYKLYRMGNFTGTAEEILVFIKQGGPASTTNLRKNLRLTGRDKKNEFTKAMDILQKAFSIVVVNKGKPPRHTHTWDLTENWMPRELIRRAELIDEQAAKAKIVAKLLENRVVSNQEEAETFLGIRS